MSIFSNTAFKNKNIIITGGAGDIGLATAKAFAKAGASNIALLDKDEKQFEKVFLEGKFDSTTYIKQSVNLAHADEIEKVVDILYSKQNHWDVLVNTAGIFIGGKLTELSVDNWDQLMQINLRQLFIISRLVAKKMMEQNYGKIIHVSSGSTFYGTPGSGGYAASKAAINHLTQTMAVEWGPYNIQVNTICPTVTQTKFLKQVGDDETHEKMREKMKQRIPLGRLLETNDIVPMILFLASEGSQLINGVVIPIDGGARFVTT